MLKLPAHYGEVRLVNVDANVYWCLIEEMLDDDSGEFFFFLKKNSCQLTL